MNNSFSISEDFSFLKNPLVPPFYLSISYFKLSCVVVYGKGVHLFLVSQNKCEYRQASLSLGSSSDLLWIHERQCSPEILFFVFSFTLVRTLNMISNLLTDV